MHDNTERSLRARASILTEIAVGDVLNGHELEAIQGAPVQIPDPEWLVHLQFRRFAGCPVCNLHLQSIAQRHDEILAAGIREVVVFHSSAEPMLELQGELPPAVLASTCLTRPSPQATTSQQPYGTRRSCPNRVRYASSPPTWRLRSQRRSNPRSTEPMRCSPVSAHAQRPRSGSSRTTPRSSSTR
jgi:hypothetical protein